VLPVSFDTFSRLQLPMAEYVSGGIGIVHDAFTCVPYEVREELPADGRDAVVLVPKEARAKAMEAVATYPGRVVLVISPADGSFRSIYAPDRRLLPANVTVAFSTNAELLDSRMISVPLGIRYSNVPAVMFVRRHRQAPAPGLAYGNFTVNRDHYRPRRGDTHHVRQRLAERAGELDWVTLDLSERRRDAPEDALAYYAQMAAHRFVLCPEGNGVDTYRVWEALYLGAVPIVMRSPQMSAFAGLPILWTDDYAELTEAYLEAAWKAMSRRVFDLGPALMSTYRQRFLEHVGLLDSPHFVCLAPDDQIDPRLVQLLAGGSRTSVPLGMHVPVAPIVSPASLTDPAVWQRRGGIVLEPSPEGLRIKPGADGGGDARQLVRTLPGARFTVSGAVAAARPLPRSSVTVLAHDGRTVLGEHGLGAGGDARFTFEVASAEPAMIVALRAGDAGHGFLLADLRLDPVL
jgi:hypothetical protein